MVHHITVSGTFISKPPVAAHGEVLEVLQGPGHGQQGPAGELGAAAEIQPDQANLVLQEELHRVVGQLLTALQTQLLQTQTLHLTEGGKGGGGGGREKDRERGREEREKKKERGGVSDRMIHSNIRQ